jgi:hypothetical protein
LHQGLERLLLPAHPFQAGYSGGGPDFPAFDGGDVLIHTAVSFDFNSFLHLP